MKKILDFFVAVLAPFLIISAYAYCYHLLESYKYFLLSYSYFFIVFISILANALSGVGMFFICKHAIHRQYSKFMLIEYLLGMLLILYTLLFLLMPPPFIFVIFFNYSIRLSGVFLGVYVCLFIYLIRRRKKAIQMHDKVRSEQSDS